MIGYLTGKIISKKPTQVLLDVNGVGYIVNITINTFESISQNKGEIVSLYRSWIHCKYYNKHF